ncbi:hypothetical protein D3C78_605470 [compost metagenome]
MLRMQNNRFINGRIRIVRFRIKLTQPEAHAERIVQRNIKIALREQSFLQCLTQRLPHQFAIIGYAVDAAFPNRTGHRFLVSFQITMVTHGAGHVKCIADNKAVHAPFLLDDGVYVRTQIRRHTINRVVRRHHGLGATLPERNFKRLQIVLTHIAWINTDRSVTAADLIIVGYKMLQGCNRLQIFRMITLNPPHKRCCQFACKHRVLPISFFGTAPTRVALHVYSRRPERQPVDLRITLIEASRLVANSASDPLHQLGIPGASQSDRLRITRSFTEPCHTMRRLCTMFIRFYTKPFDGCLILNHQSHFFLQRKTGHQVGDPFFKWKRRVLVWIVGCSRHMNPPSVDCLTRIL